MFDVVIIGGGPGGLSAFKQLQKLASSVPLRVLLVEAGSDGPLRDRSVDVCAGLGGAGLFSDGKFSFFPSATELWRLPDKEALRSAYDWTCEFLPEITAPAFPDAVINESGQDSTCIDSSHDMNLKIYPSFYISLAGRYSMINMLSVLELGDDSVIVCNTTVERCRFDDTSFILTLCNSNCTDPETVRARCVIFAGGRAGPLDLCHVSDESDLLLRGGSITPAGVPRGVFRRLELGFRIEDVSSKTFFYNEGQLDVKLKWAEDGVEWRTFCSCRDGEVVFAEVAGLWAASGRSDVPNTGRSNVGFNTRVLDPDVAARVWPQLERSLRDPASYFRLSVRDAVSRDEACVSRLRDVYGEMLTELVLNGLTQLAAAYPVLSASDTAELVGPTVEGVGWYPDIDAGLRLHGCPLPAFVCGDACGRFRGIIAAMVSGHYVATSAVKALGQSE